MSVFAYRLRIARENRNLTQRELAKRCGLSVNQINRYENDVTEPAATIISTVAAQLGISADYLLGLIDDPIDRTAPKDLNADENEIVDMFRHEGWLGVVRLGVERLPK